MSTLSTSLTDYLRLRASLGFKMKEATRELPQFLSFLDQQGARLITTKLAVQWAVRPKSAKPRYWAQRLTLVRGFARYQSGIDARTEIPPSGLLPYGNGRRRPHIYTANEIQQLLKTVTATDSARRIGPKTYAAVVGLLCVTGMRLGECLNLDEEDVNLNDGVLTIRGSKWRKSRLIPIHITTQQKRKFLRAARKIGLRGPPGTRGPYLHDFRHRFAVSTLLGWYRSGVDVERHMPELSTYLGHSHVAYTYWYLSAEPELLQLAARRLDQGKEFRYDEV
jgi:integrase